MGLGPLMDSAREGLMAARFGMEVVGRNMANSSTDGYTRQEVFFQSPQGGGVGTWAVRGRIDQFIETRLTNETQTQGRLDAERRLLGEVSPILGTTETGVDSAIGQFFAAVSALATTPDGSSERASLMFQTDALVVEINSEAKALNQLASQIDRELGVALTQVNGLATEVARLNVAIRGSVVTDGSSSELLDQRRRAVNQLASLVGVNSFSDGSGNVNISTAGGIPLVEGANHFALALTAATGFSSHPGVAVVSPGGDVIPITNRINNGAIAGMLSVRDGVISDTLADLDRVAGALALNVNAIHSQGFGLDGSTGNDLFSGLSGSVFRAVENTGGVVTGVTITDLSAVTLDDYEVVFTSATQFDVLNTTQGSVVSSGNSYTSGMALAVDGLQLTLTSSPAGPATGDRFQISTVRNQAANIKRTLTSQDQLAAAQDPTSVPGDNRNALLLADLKNSKVLDAGNTTLSQKIGRAANRMGLEQQSVESASDAQGLVMESIKMRHAEVSGVSLDEEAAKLVQLQNSYQASARLIRLADELLDNLINMV